ncbi:sensor histidine kinase [Paenibacillus sp. MMS20-IR301]|uniref:cache domain-containing sensor histidine kinase n=1 Tax=Paenibacillus sp. MMS20-IR301 TaxID=2895946 RepID=UPI0028EE279C|nr:sensor histidine kinase [Paenibacillus sp. MMS20-IR301]WNS41415.1 sensor histidine kinase [Paenibacillus sp. MMS20-IR301]
MLAHIRRFPRTLWLFLANLPMERKLIVVFIFLISLPITYVSYLSSRSTFNSVLVNATASAGQMADSASDTVDRYLTDLKRYTALPLYNTDVQFYLEQQGTDWEKNTGMSMFLSYLNHTKEEIVAVYLVDKYGSVYYDKSSGISELFPAERLAQWQSLTKEGVAPVVQGRHTIRVNASDHREVFSILRTVSSVSSLQKIGMIIFDINISLFKGIVDPVNAVTHGSTLIVDDQGGLIYASPGGGGDSPGLLENNTDKFLQQVSGPGGHFRITLDSKDYLAVYTVSEKTGWTTLVSIPLDTILSPVEKTRNTQILTTLAIIAFALIVATFISYALTKPLKSMVRLMKQVQHGNLDVWLHPRYNDEIGMLGSHFNRMIIRVKDLLQEVTLTEKRKQKADMRALQNQINPHFIYNTLESIRMLAEGSDEPRVAQLTYLLGMQMRYGIVRSEELVTIRDELDHVRNYLDMLQIRFPDKFSLQIQVQEQLLSFPVIKLVFQPIVENAVFHGLEPKQGPGRISITGWAEGDQAVFSVEDNGVGMDEVTLRALNSSLSGGADGEKFGIGLRNVNERLRLDYGSPFGLRVESVQGSGTRVTLRIEALSSHRTEE